MQLEKKLELLEEIMDAEDALEPEMELEDLEEWDSLSVLSLTLEVRKRWNRNLTTEEIKQFKTVQDICDCLE